MRAVTTATAAAALGLRKKALDHLLGHLEPSEASRGRQGVERRIPVALLTDLFLAAELAERLGLPVRSALALARQLKAGDVALGPFLRVSADIESVRFALDGQLESAIETVVRKPRGRPRAQTRR